MRIAKPKTVTRMPDANVALYRCNFFFTHSQELTERRKKQPKRRKNKSGVKKDEKNAYDFSHLRSNKTKKPTKTKQKKKKICIHTENNNDQ